MRKFQWAWIAVMIGFVALSCCGCPGSQVAKPVIEPRLEVAPRVDAGGDVAQQFKILQDTFTRMEQQRNSQVTDLIGRVDGRIESIEQNVEKTMYGLSPERLALEMQRLEQTGISRYQMQGIIVGVLCIALAAPAVGAAWMIAAFYVIGIVMIVVSIFAPLLVPLLL